MIGLRILTKRSLSSCMKHRNSVINFGRSVSQSSSSSSSDDEKTKDVHKERSSAALEKLNLLLNQMIQEETATASLKLKLQLAKPTDKRRKRIKEEVKVDPESQMINAVQEVAKVLTGDAKQTESELLQKLLYPIKEEPTTTTANSLSEIFKDMKIDRETKPTVTVSRAQQVRQLLQTAKTKQHDSHVKGGRSFIKKKSSSGETSEYNNIVDERVNLFGNDSLGIFTSAEVSTWPKQNITKTWNMLEERELQLAVTHPPANYFQQMIQWTEQGKIWKFPIDNEQGMEAEKNVHFTEHVFLQKHIESWCPPKGPICHFMELVLVGLSKNSYLSVEHKKEHLDWFKNYFNEKKELLQEVGAISADFEFIKDTSNKIEA